MLADSGSAPHVRHYPSDRAPDPCRSAVWDRQEADATNPVYVPVHTLEIDSTLKAQ